MAVNLCKTVAKVSPWGLGSEIIARKMHPNAVIRESGDRRLDAFEIGASFGTALTDLAGHPIKYIVPNAHGADVAIIRGEKLGSTPLEYEQGTPSDICGAYNAIRSPITETGSPRLPAGLNLSAQVYWPAHGCSKRYPPSENLHRTNPAPDPSRGNFR